MIFTRSGTRLAAAPAGKQRRNASRASAVVRHRLSCAAELRRQGYAVTIFDNRPLPGGLNTYGVAEYKLRPSDSLREVELVQSLGVEFRQAEVGSALSAGRTGAGVLVIFLGLGLGSMERLGIPGEQICRA